MSRASSVVGGGGSGLFNDTEFNRLVRQTLGGKSSLMMRKDRRGIAISKGQKKHKITFRDEIDF